MPNVIHLEAWGASSIASLNYERAVFHRARITVLARIGVGSIHLNDFTGHFNPDVIMPFGGYGLWGKRIALEAGVGGALTSIVYPDENDFEPQRVQRVHGWCSIGIRGNIGEHVMARIAFTPIFEFARVDLTAGFGFGYQF